MLSLNMSQKTQSKLPLILVLFCSLVFSQNLVKDPSFEKKNHCPTTYSSLDDASKHWNSPTSGTTDYFSECSDDFGPERNFIGSQKPIHGKSFAGIYMFAPNDYREYLTTELKTKLEKGKTYKIAFMVSLPEEVEYAVNNFSILFTKEKLRVSTNKNIRFKRISKNKKFNYKRISTNKFIKDDVAWQEVSTTIVANGYERYLTIGNFSNNKNTDVTSVRKKQRKSSYYFVDMVSVEKEKAFNFNEYYVFDNFQFESDEDNFQNENSDQLKKLVVFLKNNSKVNIVLNGHTDAIGSSRYNNKLSRNRAKQVAYFLEKNGISKNRIKCKGFGEKKPIAENTTESGQKKNRRVEFVLSEKVYKNYVANTFEDE